MSDIYVRLSRPEGYENVHPDLVVEDAQIDPAFAPLVVTDEIERLRTEVCRLKEALFDLTRERDELRQEKATDAWYTGWQEAVRRMQQAERERDEARAEIERLQADVRRCAGHELADLVDDLREQLQEARDAGRAQQSVIAAHEDARRQAERERDEARAEVARLREAEATFHQDYRQRCDVQTKALHVEVERLRAEVARLHAVQQIWGGA